MHNEYIIQIKKVFDHIYFYIDRFNSHEEAKKTCYKFEDTNYEGYCECMKELNRIDEHLKFGIKKQDLVKWVKCSYQMDFYTLAKDMNIGSLNFSLSSLDHENNIKSVVQTIIEFFKKPFYCYECGIEMHEENKLCWACERGI